MAAGAIRRGRTVAPNQEGTVWTATVSDSGAPRAPSPASLAETMESELSADASVPMHGDSAPAHDPTLLVAALEEIAARRAAIEWLLNADLLCLCTV